MKKNNNILSFESWEKFDNVIHGFSTKYFGSMRPTHKEYKVSIKKFAKALGVKSDKIVHMNEVHSNAVSWVKEKDRNKVVNKTDGILTDSSQVFLSVITADCIPLLLYDPKKRFVAAVHAGWRGLFSEIIKQAVSGFIAKGSKPQDISVGIGPCIRSCCYDITEEHVEKLLKKFPEWKAHIIERKGKFFLDLPSIAISQLRSLGIAKDNIEDGDYCTFQNDDVYSCRRDGKDFGEIMGVIGQL